MVHFFGTLSCATQRTNLYQNLCGTTPDQRTDQTSGRGLASSGPGAAATKHKMWHEIRAFRVVEPIASGTCEAQPNGPLVALSQRSKAGATIHSRSARLSSSTGES
jgi:hypothetical protein